MKFELHDHLRAVASRFCGTDKHATFMLTCFFFLYTDIMTFFPLGQAGSLNCFIAKLCCTYIAEGVQQHRLRDVKLNMLTKLC